MIGWILLVILTVAGDGPHDWVTGLWHLLHHPNREVIQVDASLLPHIEKGDVVKIIEVCQIGDVTLPMAPPDYFTIEKKDEKHFKLRVKSAGQADRISWGQDPASVTIFSGVDCEQSPSELPEDDDGKRVARR